METSIRYQHPLVMKDEVINKGVKITMPWTIYEGALRTEETHVTARIKTYLDPYFRRYPGDSAGLRLV